MIEFPNASRHRPRAAPRPSSTTLLPLNPTSMMTWEPRGILGRAGLTAGVVPCEMTSGLYTMSRPFGARIVASTNAASFGLASEQPSPSRHGVASPRALSGRAGTISVQFSVSAACAAVWFRLMGLPAGSTGFIPARPGWPASGLTAGVAAAALAPAVPDGQGFAADESGAGSGVAAGPVGVGAAVWPAPGAVVSGAAGLVCAGVAAWLLAGVAGGDVAGA